jgi:putative transposase
MPRPPRADEAGGLYHALNRGNARCDLFRKDADFDAFERIMSEGLQRYDVQLYAFQLMSNHWHLVLRPNQEGEMSRFLRWISGTHTMRYHAHYHTSGEGHVYQGRFKSFPLQDDEHFFTVCRYVERNALKTEMVTRAEDWRWGSLWHWLHPEKTAVSLLSPWPLPRRPGWVERVNEPLTVGELQEIRDCTKRGRPFGSPDWMESAIQRLGLESTLRPRGRPRVRNLEEFENNES